MIFLQCTMRGELDKKNTLNKRLSKLVGNLLLAGQHVSLKGSYLHPKRSDMKQPKSTKRQNSMEAK